MLRWQWSSLKVTENGIIPQIVKYWTVLVVEIGLNTIVETITCIWRPYNLVPKYAVYLEILTLKILVVPAVTLKCLPRSSIISPSARFPPTSHSIFILHPWVKKHAALFLGITLANVDRFFTNSFTWILQ